jgi:hypothetical protein
MIDGIQPADVNVLKVLKGSKEPGPLRIVTIHEIKPDTVYLLCSTGGSVMGTDFLVTNELSLIPLPRGFTTDELKGKELKEQIQYMFSRHLFKVERQLAPLLKEKKLLEKAVSDRKYESYDSGGPVRLGPIKETVTQTSDNSKFLIWLDLEGEKIEWSQSSAGKSGYFYFWKIGKGRPYWEFSLCDVNNIEELDGKRIKTKFYGMYSPGSADARLAWRGTASVGQVLLARNINNLRKVYAIQVTGQKQDEEEMTARYAVINP